MTPAEIEDLLTSTADKVGGYDYDYSSFRPGASFELGFGRLNMAAAITELIERYTPVIPPVIDVELSLADYAGDGLIEYQITTVNHTDSLQEADIWMTLMNPQGEEEMLLSSRQQFPAQAKLTKSRIFEIESNRSGEYELRLYSGVYPDSVIDLASRRYNLRRVHQQPGQTG